MSERLKYRIQGLDRNNILMLRQMLKLYDIRRLREDKSEKTKEEMIQDIRNHSQYQKDVERKTIRDIDRPPNFNLKFDDSPVEIPTTIPIHYPKYVRKPKKKEIQQAVDNLTETLAAVSLESPVIEEIKEKVKEVQKEKKKRTTKKNFTEEFVEPDGNCLFTALARLINEIHPEEQMDSPQKLRDKVYNWLLKYADYPMFTHKSGVTLKGYLGDDQDYQAFADKMKKDKEYGEAPVIQSVANHYKVHVKLYYDKEMMGQKSADFFPIQKSSTNNYYSEKGTTTFYLKLEVEGKHYTILRPDKINNDDDQPPRPKIPPKIEDEVDVWNDPELPGVNNEKTFEKKYMPFCQQLIKDKKNWMDDVTDVVYLDTQGKERKTTLYTELLTEHQQGWIIAVQGSKELLNRSNINRFVYQISKTHNIIRKNYGDYNKKY